MAKLIGQCMIKGKQRGNNHGAGGIFMHVYALMDFPYTHAFVYAIESREELWLNLRHHFMK